MASKTTNYGLNKHSPQDFYNVEARNENWDKIDEALAAADPTKVTAKVEPADGDGVMIADCADGGKAKRLLWSSVKTALGKLFVPLARKINGKALSADVTLTGDDIAMGADDAESLRAAMAKRLKDCGELSGQNDADTLTEPGFYRGGDTSKMLLHAPIISFAWTLEVLANSAWNVGVTQRFIDFETRRMFIRSNHPLESGWVWYDWAELAQCIAPEVHDLPLADGWQAYGEGLCRYTRNQFKEVTIGMLLRSTSALTSDGAQFATLPEGFRPKVTVIAPVNVTANDYSHSACHVTINPDGTIFVYQNITWGWVEAQFSFIAAN